jgi:protocatechuate 3,4-dioxygenase beta subunit
MLCNDSDNNEIPAPFTLARIATTDDEGRFVIEGVPAGEWRIEPHHVRIRARAGDDTPEDLEIGKSSN